MSHYLEHTPNPLAELDACEEVLKGRNALIEIPDPQSKVGRSLGRLWLPCFNPASPLYEYTKSEQRTRRERF